MMLVSILALNRPSTGTLAFFADLQVKVVIARYRFSSDIHKTLPIYCFTLFEYMGKVSKLLTTENPRKLSQEKNGRRG